MHKYQVKYEAMYKMSFTVEVEAEDMTKATLLAKDKVKEKLFYHLLDLNYEEYNLDVIEAKRL